MVSASNLINSMIENAWLIIGIYRRMLISLRSHKV